MYVLTQKLHLSDSAILWSCWSQAYSIGRLNVHTITSCREKFAVILYNLVKIT